MVLKAERERVKALLTEAITVLCKNGLGYKYTCAIEGLLGITLDDDDVFLVNINESIQKAERPPPVEESTKQETGTQSPASSSPSGTPRRRRRRSQEGEAGHSPAKRANYGTGEQDHSRTQPQSREDVIVIKEEVSETEFSDFYGDTGGGDNEDSGQYVMQQGDQQYPGAGCSQWDTSQTQGGQSDWPAFNPTQQQQAAISQAATSAMMSPSQGTVAISESLKCGTLRSTAVREILSKEIVDPVLANGWSVAAFRMNWPRQTDEALQTAWDNIITIRQELDRMALRLSGVKFLISSISATSSRLPSGGYRNSPSIAYWLALQEDADTRNLIGSMQGNSFGAQLKLQLQPFQKTHEQISSALFTVVKDNMEGCVRRLVEEAQRRYYGGAGLIQPIVKLFVKDQQIRNMLHPTVANLNAARFPVDMLEIV